MRNILMLITFTIKIRINVASTYTKQSILRITISIYNLTYRSIDINPQNFVSISRRLRETYRMDVIFLLRVFDPFDVIDRLIFKQCVKFL